MYEDVATYILVSSPSNALLDCLIIIIQHFYFCGPLLDINESKEMCYCLLQIS